MKVDVIKELEKNRTNTQKSADGLINEVKFLMDASTQNEREALKIIGLDKHLHEVELANGVELERKKFEDHYGSKAFTKNELKAICIKYDLRMLPTRRFMGKLDTQIASKLARFCEKHKSEIGNYSDNFFIIAPPYAFNLDNRPAKVKNVDPILVYKVPREDQYIFIHKWGIDFTV